jgi:hypothetical protein
MPSRYPTPRRALELLARCPEEGCSETLMLAHGFTIEQLVESRPRRPHNCEADCPPLPIEPHGGLARRRQCLPPRFGDLQRGDFELVGAGDDAVGLAVMRPARPRLDQLLDGEAMREH